MSSAGPRFRSLLPYSKPRSTSATTGCPSCSAACSAVEHDEPVHYPVSCSPQAWASGSWFLMLTSVLGIRPSAQRRELNIINPELPPWLDYLRIRNLRIGNNRVGLDFTRHRDRTFCNVVDVEGKLVKTQNFRLAEMLKERTRDPQPFVSKQSPLR